MRSIENIEKTAKALGFQFEKINDFNVVVTTKTEKIIMTRSSFKQPFGVAEKTKAVNYMQQEYNANTVRNWGLKNGYKAKSEYQKVSE
jgi:DNA primase